MELAVKGMLPRTPGQSHDPLHAYAGASTTRRPETRRLTFNEEVKTWNCKILYGTGRRKKSVARVYLNGNRQDPINDRDIDEYFGLETLK